MLVLLRIKKRKLKYKVVSSEKRLFPAMTSRSLNSWLPSLIPKRGSQSSTIQTIKGRDPEHIVQPLSAHLVLVVLKLDVSHTI